MKGEIDSISAKIQTLEVNQETSHKENQATHSRLDDMAVKVKEIRLLTGVRYGRNRRNIFNLSTIFTLMIQSDALFRR